MSLVGVVWLVVEDGFVVGILSGLGDVPIGNLERVESRGVLEPA